MLPARGFVSPACPLPDSYVGTKPVLAARDGPLVHVSSRFETEKGENGSACGVSKLAALRSVKAAFSSGAVILV